MIISTNGLAFIEDDDLLVVGFHAYFPNNNYLTKYTKYDVECWKIDFDIFGYDVNDIASIAFRPNYAFIIMTDGTIFTKGKQFELILNVWQQIYFPMPISRIFILENFSIVLDKKFVIILDMDKNLWYCNHIIYNTNQNRYEFTDLKRIDSYDIAVVDVDYINDLMLSEHGLIFKFDENQCQLIKSHLNLPIIRSITYYSNKKLFLDIDGRLHFIQEEHHKIIELPNKSITCCDIYRSDIFFASDNVLYYKLDNCAVCEISALQTQSKITLIMANKRGSLVVACLDGHIYFLSVVDDEYVIQHIISTNYDFSTRTIRGVKSANKY